MLFSLSLSSKYVFFCVCKWNFKDMNNIFLIQWRLPVILNCRSPTFFGAGISSREVQSILLALKISKLQIKYEGQIGECTEKYRTFFLMKDITAFYPSA